MKAFAKKSFFLFVCVCMILSSVAITALAKTPAEIVEEAYALASGGSLSYECTLTGIISEIDTPYSSQYKNISVDIKIEGCEDKPILCYRLKGDGADELAVGDTITVTGTIINYNGIIEFGSGCTLDAVVKGEGEAAKAPETVAELIAAAYALEENESLPYEASLIGEIISVDTPYDSGYKNITVTIAVKGYEDKPIMCYRLKGEGAETLEVGKFITVTGVLTNYRGTIEFKSGCALNEILDKLPEVSEEQTAIVDAAYALESGKSLESASTLVGKITKIDTPYSSQYKNISVTVEIAGREDKPILCYRLKGEGADELAVGDTITVTGTLMNYNGIIEFGSGCTLDEVVKGEGEAVKAPETVEGIIDAAFDLEAGESLPYEATLTGKIVSVDTPYDSGYKNVTVTIAVEGFEDKPIQCFRLKGDNAETIAEGDVITVTGVLMNYNGKIEFGSGCVLNEVGGGNGDSGNDQQPKPGDMSNIIVFAFLAVAALAGSMVLAKKRG